MNAPVMINELKPYPAYKESGLPWVGEIPTHWDIRRGKTLFVKTYRPPREEDETVTCFRDGTVTLRKNRRTTGFTEALKEIGYQGIRVGDLVIHAMDAFAGAVGVSDSDGKSSPVYSVCKPRDDANPHYYAMLVRRMALTGWIQAQAKGIRERSTDFRFSDFGENPLPLPPPEEQAAIVRFLDHANRKIDRFIRGKKKLKNLVSERLNTLTEQAILENNLNWEKLARIVEVVSRPAFRENNKTYTRLGLYNRGRGVFHKPTCLGSELGDSDFFWVKSGDLIISGQFAWEGAVALATETENDCVVSHRYPVLNCKNTVMSNEVLLAIFRSSFGQLIMDYNSRGAAGRNRPLNLRSLLNEKIPVISDDKQIEIQHALREEAWITLNTQKWVRVLEEYRTRLTADVVTGKLDVREAAFRVSEELENEFPNVGNGEDAETGELEEDLEEVEHE